jgi:hypothetical protein
LKNRLVIAQSPVVKINIEVKLRRLRAFGLFLVFLSTIFATIYQKTHLPK